MFAPISAIFGLLLSTAILPNGIRLIELPSNADSVEIIAGYDETGLTGLASSVAARALIFNAYAAGGEIQVLNEEDRTGLRFVFPKWALPMVTDQQLAGLFKDIPTPMARESAASALDFRGRVEEEIRDALLGAQGQSQDYATDDAFVAISAPITDTLRQALTAIPRRLAANKDAASRLRAERTLRFTSELPTGAVIFAAPVPSVYYREWYLVLLLDRMIRGSVRAPLQTSLLLSLHPYYYRLEVSLSAGQFPEPAEESLLQDLQRLQFTLLDPARLSSVKQKTLEYLDSKEVRGWFATRGISERLEEGLQWIQSVTSDDLRAAARDLLLSNRVIATWAPKPAETQVEVENLAENRQGLKPVATVTAAGQQAATVPFELTPFPTHMDASEHSTVPERLASGISLLASDLNAVFVSGGALTKYNREPDAEIMKSFQEDSAERILVLTPAATLNAMRDLWTGFKGSNGGEAGVPRGPISSGDLPALYVLKTMLDLRVIQAGWWPGVELRIEANAGSALQIRADEEKRQQILAWIKDIAARAPSDQDFVWIREVALHRFKTVRSDLQALTWERDPKGAIQDIQTVVPKFVQDVAQIYF